MISDLRPFATDKAIVDWLELREIFASSHFTTQQVQHLWHCSQPAACRRLQTLVNLQLVTTIQRSNGYHPSIFCVEGSC
jgi:hypothetical protein